MSRSNKLVIILQRLKYNVKNIQKCNIHQYCKSSILISDVSLAIRNNFKRVNNLYLDSRNIHLCPKLNKEDKKSFLSFDDFQTSEKKNKETFLAAIKLYKHNFPNRKGLIEFIDSARKQMKDFGVHDDLESYKKLLDVMPKGVFEVKTKFQAGMMKFPKQQFCAADVINQMTKYGVIPDVKLGEIINSIFGKHSFPSIKFRSLMYWSLKFKNKCPWEIPKKVPSDPFLLAKLAIKQITSVDVKTEISIYQTADLSESNDKTWIVSAQSPKQKELLQNHMLPAPVIVEEGENIWIREKMIKYFILKADCEPHAYKPPKDKEDIFKIESEYLNPDYVENEEEELSVHEQDNETIYAVCATGSSSKDSLLSWVRFLQKNGNPILNDVPVLFRFIESDKAPALQTENPIMKDHDYAVH